MAFWSRLLGLAILPVTFGCAADLPPLTVVLDVDWQESRTTVEGEERWRTFRLESDSLVVTQHCGATEVEAVIPATHRYVVYVNERIMVNTVVGDDNCMALYSMAGFELELDADGQAMRTIAASESTVLRPYTEVNGIYGGRSFQDDDGSDVEWYFTPTTIETVVRCPNNLNASATVPIDLEHYLELEATERVVRSEGGCELTVEPGAYRYSPDNGELNLVYDVRHETDPTETVELRLTRE